MSEAEVEPAVREEELTHSGASEELLAQSEASAELDHHLDMEAGPPHRSEEPVRIHNAESIPESNHRAVVELEWFREARCLGAIR